MNQSQQEPPVSVIIVNYNAKPYIQTCLNSVLKTRYANFEVIVIDNGSVDGSQDYLRSVVRFNPVVKTIYNNKNFGPAFARNQGIKESKGEFVAFIDNDTTVHPDWLKEAVGIFIENSKLGACQCKLIIDGTDNLIDCVGEYLGQNGFLVQIAIPGKEKDIGQYDTITDIFAAKSAGMIARKDVFESIGGFDDDYFIYLEESDLCWRIWLYGYRVVLAPHSIVYHKFGASSLILSDRINYLVKFHGSKNYIATLIKNLELKNLIKILPVHITIWLGVAFVFLLKIQLQSVRYILKGILWNAANYKKLTEKRQLIQSQRLVSDKDIFPMIMRKRNFGYFVDKLRRKKKIGQATGWDKGT